MGEWERWEEYARNQERDRVARSRQAELAAAEQRGAERMREMAAKAITEYHGDLAAARIRALEYEAGDG